MRRIGRQSRSAIGLDLGSRHVKAVQLERAPVAAKNAPRGTAGFGAPPTGWRVATAARVSRATPGDPLGSDEAARLYRTLGRLGFTGADVVLAAPAEGLLTGVLELPPRNALIPLEQIARVELARTNKCGPETFEMGYWELPAPARAAKSTHVMAVGYPHAGADRLLDLVEHAGFNVVALDVRCCAVARACGTLAAAPPGITALLDVGWSSASLTLLYAGMVVYVRTLAESGAAGLHGALSARLRLDPEMVEYLLGEVGLRDPQAGTAAAAVSGSPSSKVDLEIDAPGAAANAEPRLALPAEARGVLSNYADGLVRDLLVSFSYVARQYTDATVSRLLVVGAGASVPGLCEHLSKELGLETTAVSPRDLTECPPGLLEVCSSAELTPAVGLAQFPET